ncbi:MAG TPA: VOC family protein [Kofleriaceae bacterium]|nr:VOC family protein [Kofleriaceae bacterium]
MANPIVHWELMVSDVEATKRFYAKVFDWRFTPAGPEYTLIETGNGPGGGLMARPPQVPASVLNTYFDVGNLDGALAAVVEAGGTVIVPKTEVPGIGWFAMFLDPDRIPIGIMQTKGSMS